MNSANNSVLETKRLFLKPIHIEQLEDLIELRGSLDVMRHIGEGKVQTPEEVLHFIESGKDYYKQYGFDFFSVFEKDTGTFVGQAGLFHVGFDVTQSDIELAYRFHKRFWQKGYATECANALIQWGFHHHGLSEIVAFVRPDNERSRRVLERAGMSYQGFVEFRKELWPCYVIKNNAIDESQIKIKPASVDDCPIMQNMANLYAYDLSAYMHWPLEKDGTASIGMDFSHYWQSPDTYPYFVYYQEHLAGFVIVDKQVTDAKNDYNIAHFFIARPYQGRGLGNKVALWCFKQFPGKWEVFVMPENEGAYRFWRKTIREHTRSQVKESSKIVNGLPRNVFEFSSSKK